MQTPEISVVIPTFNRAKMVCDCVRSVLATGYPSLEVIVVDDHSDDDTSARITKEFRDDSRVKCIRHERNKLLAAARNTGANAANGEYIFLLDDDNIVHPDIITELLAGFQRHPDAGLVAPLAINRRLGMENLIWSLGNDFNRWRSTPVNRCENLPLSKLPDNPIDFPTTYSCNAFMVPASLYRKVGGADESLVMVYEESDFGWRILKNGHSAWITTKARTTHLGFQDPDSTPQLRLLGIQRPVRAYYFARNRLRFSRRHFSLLQSLCITLFFAPLSCVYYCTVALKNRRPDIAWAYLRGTLAGIFGL